MHELFLKKVREDISRLEAELQELRAVEHYHSQFVPDVPTVNGSVATDAFKSNETQPEQLDPNLRRQDAIKQALATLGGQATTSQIVEWLKERGVGKNLKPPIFYNGIFTTLQRGAKAGDFKRVRSEGALLKWKLVASANESQPQDAGSS